MADDTPTKDPPIVRKFSVVVASLAKGEADFQIQAELEAMLDKVRAVATKTAKPQKGTLTLKLTCVVNDEGTVDLFYKVDTNEPELPTKSSLGFVTRQGKFTFQQPMEQEELFTRPRLVDRDDPAPKEANSNNQSAKEV